MEDIGVNTEDSPGLLSGWALTVPHKPLRAGTEFCSSPGPRASLQNWWHFLSPWHHLCSEDGVLPVPSPHPHASFHILSCAWTIAGPPLAPASQRPPSHCVSAPASC